MDWRSWSWVGAIVIPIVIAVIGGTWVVKSDIAASEFRTHARIDAVKDDLSNLQAEVGYIKGRLDPLKVVGDEEAK